MKANNKSTLFVRAAAEDYIAARCCLLNSLLSGLVLAEQAIEKILKAYIYLQDPSIRLVSAELHSIELLATRVTAMFPQLTWPVEQSFLEKLTLYFNTKYPDAKSEHPRSRSTAELISLDILFIYLCVELPFNPDLKGRIGIYPWIGDPGPTNRIWRGWLLPYNDALTEAVQQQIQRDYLAALSLPMPDIEGVMQIRTKT
jgi:hypothetical protein